MSKSREPRFPPWALITRRTENIWYHDFTATDTPYLKPRRTTPTRDDDAPNFTFQLRKRATIEEQICSFRVRLVMNSYDCARMESRVFRDLTPILDAKFGKGNYELQSFGSTATGTALRGCDLDINLNIVGRDISDPMQLCYQGLSSSEKFGDVVKCHARGPIVKANHKPSRTDCDISFCNSLGFEKGNLLRYYMHLHPLFLDVMLVIKFWAKAHDICDGAKSVSSHAWTLLFIAYLQTLKVKGQSIVPSVYEMQGGHLPVEYPSRIITNSFAGRTTRCRVDFFPEFTSVQLPSKPEFSFLGLLTRFFRYYRSFPFDEYIVCPYLGFPIPRHREPEGLTDIRIRSHISRSVEYFQHFGNDARLVQDPYDHKQANQIRSFPNPDSLQLLIAKAADICERTMRRDPAAKSRFLEVLFS